MAQFPLAGLSVAVLVSDLELRESDKDPPLSKMLIMGEEIGCSSEASVADCIRYVTCSERSDTHRDLYQQGSRSYIIHILDHLRY